MFNFKNYDDEERVEIFRTKVLYYIINSQLKIQYINTFGEWSGGNFFFCKKKLITGPLSLKSMIVTLTIQIIPLILFMVFNIEVII